MIAELLDTAAGAVGGPLAGMAVTGVTNFVLNRLGAAFGVPADPATLAPAIEDGRLPSATWAMIGTIVGVGVLAGLLVANWPEIQRIWSGHPPLSPAAYRPAVWGGPQRVCQVVGMGWHG